MIAVVVSGSGYHCDVRHTDGWSGVAVLLAAADVDLTSASTKCPHSHTAVAHDMNHESRRHLRHGLAL